MIDIKDEEFLLLKDHLDKICGIEVPPEKKYLFKTRLNEFMTQEGCISFTDFYHRLKDDKDNRLRKLLVEAMTTKETSFFRDTHVFQALSDEVFPALLKRVSGTIFNWTPTVRMWSAACSTGQEPYSIAMSILEWLANNKTNMAPENFRIYATDISTRVLDIAKKGVYAKQDVSRNVPPVLLRKYFRQGENSIAVNEEVKRFITFAERNLAEPFEELGHFDIIFCRNVLIYFSRDLKQKILSQFHKLLKPDGMLILGSSENLYNCGDMFRSVHAGGLVYYLPANS